MSSYLWIIVVLRMRKSKSISWRCRMLVRCTISASYKSESRVKIERLSIRISLMPIKLLRKSTSTRKTKLMRLSGSLKSKKTLLLNGWSRHKHLRVKQWRPCSRRVKRSLKVLNRVAPTNTVTASLQPTRAMRVKIHQWWWTLIQTRTSTQI